MSKQKNKAWLRIEDESDNNEFRQFALQGMGEMALRVVTSKSCPTRGVQVLAMLPFSIEVCILLSEREEVKALHTMLGNALKCMDAAKAAEKARIKAGGQAWDAGVPF